MRASRVFVFLPFVQLLVVGLIVFWPTFELYINADNWIVLWGAKTTIGTASHPWTGWTTYFSPYGMSHMIMYLMSGVFGYAGLPYYVASFFLRFLAASGVYLFLKSIKVAKTSAFLSAVMFLVSPVGLEVTDWVFQMNSFLSIFFLLLTFILLFKLDSTKK